MMSDAELIQHDAATYADAASVALRQANHAGPHMLADPPTIADWTGTLVEVLRRLGEQIGHIADKAEILPAAARDAKATLGSNDDTPAVEHQSNAVADLRATATGLFSYVGDLDTAHAALGHLRFDYPPDTSL